MQGLVSFGPPPVMSGTEGSVLPSTTSPVLLASFSPSFASSFCAISARCCFIRPPSPFSWLKQAHSHKATVALSPAVSELGFAG